MLVSLLVSALGGGPMAAGSQDVASVLAEACFACHGPDGGSRQAGLRLDAPGLLALREAGSEILSTQAPGESELLARVMSTDADLRMPPPEAKLELTTGQLRVLEDWIHAGAPVQNHWSFRSLRGSGSEIDTAIADHARLEGLRLSAAAEPEAWLRRVSFALTGLPPTLEELNNFLARGDRVEEVDRLLGSRRYGERMAADWLDLARYADTYGYQSDVERPVWPWRDWVVKAFNEGLPYDQFVRWQLAGDLLPDATQEQRLATAFQRLHRQTNEGGSVEEEYRLEYVGDRTHTFGTAFLGLTLECARCHDHKFDPLTQKEYFQLSGFFANIDESGLYSHFTNATPTPALTLESLEARDQAMLARNTLALEELAMQGVPDKAPVLEGWYALNELGTAGRLENLANIDAPGKAAGGLEVIDDSLAFDGDHPATFPGVGLRRRYEPASFGLWIYTPKLMDRAVLLHRSKAWHDSGSRGYQLLIEDGRLSASWIHFWPGDALRVQTVDPIPVGTWTHLAVGYDGTSQARGLRIWVDGVLAPLEIMKDKLTRKIVDGAESHLTLGERFRDRGFLGGRMRGLTVFDGVIGDEVAALLAQSDGFSLEALNASLAAMAGTPDEQQAWSDIRARRKALADARDRLPQIMVMEEMVEPRDTHVLTRGSYLTPGERVDPGVPAALPDWPVDAPANRLGLADWLLQPDHPLTARVAVNRLWAQVFGRGIVETQEDFGVQGTPPSHPELLDQLALEFVASGWDVKAMLRRLVLSETFQRSSVAAPNSLELDPDNRWLARGTKGRLSAEMLRDTALALGGLLVETVGGPPVRPYQPAGLWREVSGRTYTPNKGDGLYRRSLYTIWKRTAPPPSMELLDASKRDVCVARRQTTSTPLQSLVLWNDPQFVEGSRAFAQRSLKSGSGDGARMERAFREATSRWPEPREHEALLGLLADLKVEFQADPDGAAGLLSVGDSVPDPELDPAELAAWTCVLNTLLASDACVVLR